MDVSHLLTIPIAELQRRLGMRSYDKAWRIVNGKMRAGAERAIQIEGLKVGIKRGDLRPDLWPEKRHRSR